MTDEQERAPVLSEDERQPDLDERWGEGVDPLEGAPDPPPGAASDEAVRPSGAADDLDDAQ